MTITNFCIDDKLSFRIEPLGIDVDTYPNYSGECTDEPLFFKRNYRDPLVADYLKSKEAALLRETYIAFLLNEDFYSLGKMHSGELKQKLQELKSVKEYAFFENDQHFLFSKEGLSKFFPKYSGIEYYFTCMFVNNLLWDKKSKDS